MGHNGLLSWSTYMVIFSDEDGPVFDGCYDLKPRSNQSEYNMKGRG